MPKVRFNASTEAASQSTSIDFAPIWPDKVVRRKLSNGAVILTLRDSSSPTVSFRALLPHAGIVADLDSGPGTARFVAAMLTRGTESASSEGFAKELDGLGAYLHPSVTREMAVLDGRALVEDLDRLLTLAQEILQAPSFPPEEAEQVRGEILTDIRIQGKNTRAAAMGALSRLVYPAPHPFGLPLEGREDHMAIVSRDDLVAFWRRRYGPAGAIFAAVGDFDPDYAADAIASRSERWNAVVELLTEPDEAAAVADIRREVFTIEGKAQADIALGVPGLRRTDPLYLPLMVGDLILGYPQFGRIWNALRENLGIAYHAFTMLPAGRWGGPWCALCGVAPENVGAAVEAVVNEFVRMRDEGPTPQEIEDAITNRLGRTQIEWPGNAGKVQLLALTEFHDLGLDYWMRLPNLLRTVTRDIVIEAFRRWFPGAYAVAVAGPARMAF